MKTLFTEEQIAKRVDELGAEIVRDIEGPFTLAPILTGGFVFGADLARAIYRAGGDATVDFVKLYGQTDLHST